MDDQVLIARGGGESVTMEAGGEKGSLHSLARGRPGRPRKEFVGAVDARILAAARKVFLERGYDGASMDEIAETARAGKPTIYARYANKEALFAAAFIGHIADKNTRAISALPPGKTLDENLATLAEALLAETLTAEGVELTRLAIAKARNFPNLGASICRIARERGVETIVRLVDEASSRKESGACPLQSAEHKTIAARIFLDVMVLPMLLRALAGEDLDTLKAEIGLHVSQRMSFFLAACRNGGPL